MSVKTLATISAVILLASASLASAQVRTRAEPSHVKSNPLVNSYFDQEYWKDFGQFMVPSDPDPTKGTVFETH
jgi:hypothetical protein